METMTLERGTMTLERAKLFGEYVSTRPLDEQGKSGEAARVLFDALTAAEARIAEAEAGMRAALDESSRAWSILTGQHAGQTRPEGSLVAAAERAVREAREAGFREAREQAAKVAERYGDIARGCETIQPGEASQTIADAIRALAPAEKPAPFAAVQAAIAADQRGELDEEEAANAARTEDAQMRAALERIAAQHHTEHCIARQAWGDGECECRKPAPTPSDAEAPFLAMRNAMKHWPYAEVMTVSHFHAMLDAAIEAAGRNP